jgi:glycosyltransferase involved in cell wall biosynthesis
VRERLKSLNLANKIFLTEFRKDVPEVMNALDVFVMPSYEENFGNVLLEALASGLPTIGTNSGGTPEILDQGETGLLCEPRSADALAQSMIKILQPSVAADLRQKARAKAERDYDMNRVFQRIESLVTN